MKNPMFAFATCLRHAFMTGAGYEKEFEKIEVADLDRWTHYDPPSRPVSSTHRLKENANCSVRICGDLHLPHRS
nr:MAG TPA: hypothetical protein [Caudoviricetes sp.]